MPRITAAVCTYDRYELLPGAIASLLAQTPPAGGFSVLVIDNSPDHARAREIAQRYAGETRLRYVVEETAGLSNARNVAVHACGTELVAFMDDDAVAAPDWLERIVEAFDVLGEAVAVVGGRVVPRWPAARPAWLHERHLGYLSVVDWGGTLREAAAGEWLAGTNIAFRTASVRDAGGFATELGRHAAGAHALLGNEEIELIGRLKERGAKAAYAPAAMVEHLIDHARLSREWFRRRAAWQAVSDMISDPAALLARLAETREPKAALERLRTGEHALAELTGDVDDAEEFSRRLRAIYWSTVCMLAGRGPGRP